jgi:acetyl-CoA C-acetyltransferase
VAARQTLIKAGLPPETPSISIDKACVSGMSAIQLGCRAMVAGEIECAIGGGYALGAICGGLAQADACVIKV